MGCRVGAMGDLGPVSGGSERPWARGRWALGANFDGFVRWGPWGRRRWEHCYVSTQNEEEIRRCRPGARPAWGAGHGEPELRPAFLSRCPPEAAAPRAPSHLSTGEAVMCELRRERGRAWSLEQRTSSTVRAAPLKPIYFEQQPATNSSFCLPLKCGAFSRASHLALARARQRIR